MDITTELVKRLVEEQFPQWKDLEVRPVARSGHDNRTFHLGNTMAVRLPSGKNYAAQSAKEIRWLPYLQNHLDFPISKPVAAGKPTEYYPFPWSVNLWLEGNTLFEEDPLDQQLFAKDLAAALKKLQAIDSSDGSRAGIHNFYRGGDLGSLYFQHLSGQRGVGSWRYCPREYFASKSSFSCSHRLWGYGSWRSCLRLRNGMDLF